jgi:hypothetical protein
MIPTPKKFLGENTFPLRKNARIEYCLQKISPHLHLQDMPMELTPGTSRLATPVCGTVA